MDWPVPGAGPDGSSEDGAKSVNQLHAMIRDLLEATRADSGKLRIEPRCIDIGELVRQAVAMMRPTAAEKHVGSRMRCWIQTIPLVYADPDRTLEVLINLSTTESSSRRRRLGGGKSLDGGNGSQLGLSFGERQRARHSGRVACR